MNGAIDTPGFFHVVLWQKGLLKEGKDLVISMPSIFEQGMQHQYNTFGRYGTWWQKARQRISNGF